jgi:putative pyruvate formate lyase activating enzyme
VRHLVLPNDLAGTGEAVTFLAQLSANTYLNVMGQYRPCYRALVHPPLARRPSTEEMERAFRLARAAGLTRLDGVA